MQLLDFLKSIKAVSQEKGESFLHIVLEQLNTHMGKK